VDASEPTFGNVLTLLSNLDRRGFEAQVTPLRERLRVALRELPTAGLHAEISAVRVAAEALGRRA
jgi:hypothetical protein